MLANLVRPARLLSACLITSLALMAMPGPVAAAGQDLGQFQCWYNGGGEATVEANVPLTLHWGWVDVTRGQVEDYIHNVSFVITVDGTTVVPDLTLIQGPAQGLNPPIRTAWQAIWYWDFGTLSAGTTTQVNVEWWLAHPSVGLPGPSHGRPTHVAPGLQLVSTCAITAE